MKYCHRAGFVAQHDLAQIRLHAAHFEATSCGFGTPRDVDYAVDRRISTLPDSTNRSSKPITWQRFVGSLSNTSLVVHFLQSLHDDSRVRLDSLTTKLQYHAYEHIHSHQTSLFRLRSSYGNEERTCFKSRSNPDPCMIHDGALGTTKVTTLRSLAHVSTHSNSPANRLGHAIR